MDNIVLEIGLALGLIAFAVLAANKLGLSNIPFLIIIGMIAGPHAPQFGVFDFCFAETGSPLNVFTCNVGMPMCMAVAFLRNFLNAFHKLRKLF